jgi:hypothetical protein
VGAKGGAATAAETNTDKDTGTDTVTDTGRRGDRYRRALNTRCRRARGPATLNPKNNKTSTLAIEP